MTISLVNLTNEKIKQLFPRAKCSRCLGEIEEHPDEAYKISGKILCSDCYR